MQIDDKQEFATLMQEMAAMSRAPFSEFLVSGYWRILKGFPLSAIRSACLQLLGDENRKHDMPSAAEIKTIARTFAARGVGREWYIRCQQPHCPAEVQWPPRDEGEGRMYCGIHQPQPGTPATTSERIAIAEDLTPKARAFLRSPVPELMATIPVTDEEAAFTEPTEPYRLAKARKAMSDQVIAEAYGVSVAEVKAAQANASQRTLEHV